MSYQKINTKIWLEEPEENNEFATQKAFCHGYDVYGQMLGKASWAQMIYLLFRGQPPTDEQIKVLDTLAVALMNPGPRDPSVHAAMCAGVGGSVTASALIAYLGVGAGQVNGSREVFLIMKNIKECDKDLTAWEHRLRNIEEGVDDTWQKPECVAGFEPYGVTASTIVIQTLEKIAQFLPQDSIAHLLKNNQSNFEIITGMPINMNFVAATALNDLGFEPQTGEMLHLMLRMPGAAAHALEQYDYGFKNFPFYDIEVLNDPIQKESK